MQTKTIPTFTLPNWFPKYFFETQWYIHSTGRDDEGRTPLIMYHIQGREVSVFTGQTLNSEKDIEAITKMSNEMAKVHQDFLHKQAHSELEASKIFLV